MKIIAVDNFNRENHDDRLVCENISSDREAKVILTSLQIILGGERCAEFYKIVDDNYKLYTFKP